MQALWLVAHSLALLPSLSSQQAVYLESISGLGLLGDHAGVPSINASFDYVVVGGGTAGLTIATRLAENGSFSVAVIEAGGFHEFLNGNFSTVPGTAGLFIGTAPSGLNPLVDWGYKAEPDSGLGGRSILYNSGKSLGGGSSRNYMVYDRGPKSSYQRWADEVGDETFEFDNFLPYFQRSVTYTPPHFSSASSNDTITTNGTAIGNGGPLHVSFFSWVNALGSWATLALRELGLVKLDGLVSGRLLGFSHATVTVDGDTQTRSSSETSFLRSALKSTSDLVIYQDTLAKKILFNNDRQALGVLVNSAGSQYTLSANKEVIVSAGAHRSPQLLMVSGVGPKAILDQFQIPVVSELAGVGQNMWDQPFFGPSWPVELVTHSALTSDPAFAAAQLQAYRTNRTGMLTNSGSDFVAWENLPDALRSSLRPETRAGLEQYPPDWPELQYTFADAYYGYGRDSNIGAPTDGRMYISILPALVATLSRGNVTINSTDTTTNPVISPNLLNDPRDKDVAVAAFKRARQIANTKAFQTIINGPEAFPGVNVTTDAEILSIVMQSAAPIWHACATNKMGKISDPMAVLDSQARVRGVQGLRVVDASAFPFLVPCHPSATVYALAEKIADIILSAK